MFDELGKVNYLLIAGLLLLQVLPGSTPTTAIFKSSLFGSLGAGLTVAPNTIDFNTVFQDPEKKLVEVKYAIFLKYKDTK